MLFDQLEITKYNVKEVCELASAVSDTVICSGLLPVYRGDEIHSRLLSLNGWMSKWCPQNNIGSPSWELRTASPRGHYGERLQRDSCLKKHMKKHHPLAGDSP